MSASLRSRNSLGLTVSAPLALIGLAWVVGATGSPVLRDEVTLALCSLVIVLGLQLFIGNSGVYSFGHIAFAAIGAYTAALLTIPPSFSAIETPGLSAVLGDLRVPAALAVLIAAGLCGLVAALVGLPLLRTSTLAIPISTFAFLIVTYNALSNWDALTAGSGGLVDVPTAVGIGWASLCAGVATLLVLAFKLSARGYRLQASRDDEVAARSIGIEVTRERLISFVLSGVICGIGGALAVQESGVLTPATFYFGATVSTLTMLVIGGTRSVFGAVLGALAVGAISECLRGVEEGAHLFGLISIGETPGLASVALGLALLAAIILRPEGLSGGSEAGELLLGAEARSGAHALPDFQESSLIQPTDPDKLARGELVATGVSVRLGGIQILDGIDLCLARGEILGLIGPNGAGKTTLANVLSGFQRPDEGAVKLDGGDLGTLSPASRARRGLARSFQGSLPFTHLTALESVAVGAMGVGRRKRDAIVDAEAILAQLGLGGRLQAPAGSLPPGEQRLLGIGRALATGPRYLLLDEPAAGLNDAETHDLTRILAAINADFECGMLVIEHDMTLVMELCPRIQVLEGGATLAIGTAQEILSDRAVRESYLGTAYLAGADA